MDPLIIGLYLIVLKYYPRGYFERLGGEGEYRYRYYVYKDDFTGVDHWYDYDFTDDAK